MRQKEKKIYFQIKYWLGVVVVGLVVGLSIQFVVAWGEPNQDPPSGGPIIQGGGGGVTGGCYTRFSGMPPYGGISDRWGKGCKAEGNTYVCKEAAMDGYECGMIFSYVPIYKILKEMGESQYSGYRSVCLCVKSSE